MNKLLFFSLFPLLFVSPALASNNNNEYEPKTCGYGISIAECNEINEKAKSEQSDYPMCSIVLADGQQITIYKESTKSCSTSQEELGGWTYERFQEEDHQKFINSMNESVCKTLPSLCPLKYN